jgi:hypothetical protein
MQDGHSVPDAMGLGAVAFPQLLEEVAAVVGGLPSPPVRTA